MQNKSKTKL